jgi:DNA polymerase-3 subunit gamma/tau
MLLAGRYIDALMLFDEVLSRGFSPQVFIAGLNAHMRDLLLAKGPAISLVEFTGTLVERYKSQAVQCDEAFLFGAISLLTEADGKIRQSSNQRLLVELGLMKIAGLGQKKNDEIGDITFLTSYPLPELMAEVQKQAPQQAAVQSTTQPAPQMAAPQMATPQAAPNPAPASKPQTPTPETPATGSTAKAEAPTEQAPRRSAPRRTSVGGISLNNLIGQSKTATEIVAIEEAKGQNVDVDPACQEKITLAKERIKERILRERPRIGVAFQTMSVKDNVVNVKVASNDLNLEIMHEKGELQRLIAAESGAYGFIDIEVTVNEQIRAARPITIEDRVKHLVSKNERFKEMIETLMLDAE